MDQAERVVLWRCLFGRGRRSVRIFEWVGLPLAGTLTAGPLLAGGCSVSYSLCPLLALVTL